MIEDVIYMIWLEICMSSQLNVAFQVDMKEMIIA